MRLGRMYLTGNGLSADVATALSWYQQANSPLAAIIQAAESGDAQEQFTLASILEETAESPEDPRTAHMYYS